MPDKPGELETGSFHPLDADWGARLMLAANQVHHADPDQMAWWLGLLSREDNVRPLRALRILTEAVQ